MRITTICMLLKQTHQRALFQNHEKFSTGIKIPGELLAEPCLCLRACPAVKLTQTDYVHIITKQTVNLIDRNFTYMAWIIEQTQHKISTEYPH